ncbi:hypothetical protein [Xanthobacter sp. KR7-225]|uniref:hypothetical protein n=1 Tax=Xanthobacter sp. KR7-225 TaxID=3156613 RepID=UPI0032B58BCB
MDRIKTEIRSNLDGVATVEYFNVYKTALLYGLAPFLVSVGLAVGLAVLIGRLLRLGLTALVPVSLAFSAIGAATGYFMGASRDSAVAAVAPAILTFVSGVVAYQFAKRGETFEPLRKLLPLAVSAMFLAAVVSASLAAAGRQGSELYARYMDEFYKNQVLNNEVLRKERLLRFEKVTLPIELERSRRALGLPAPAPVPPPSPAP